MPVQVLSCVSPSSIGLGVPYFTDVLWPGASQFMSGLEGGPLKPAQGQDHSAPPLQSLQAVEVHVPHVSGVSHVHAVEAVAAYAPLQQGIPSTATPSRSRPIILSAPPRPGAVSYAPPGSRQVAGFRQAGLYGGGGGGRDASFAAAQPGPPAVSSSPHMQLQQLSAQACVLPRQASLDGTWLPQACSTSCSSASSLAFSQGWSAPAPLSDGHIAASASASMLLSQPGLFVPALWPLGGVAGCSSSASSACGSFSNGIGSSSLVGRDGGGSGGGMFSLTAPGSSASSAGNPSPTGSLQLLSIVPTWPGVSSSVLAQVPLPPPQPQVQQLQLQPQPVVAAGVPQHRWGVDPRLVVGTPAEVAWEVLQSLPGLAALLELEPHTASGLRNLAVQEDPARELPAGGAAPGSTALPALPPSTAASSSSGGGGGGPGGSGGSGGDGGSKPSLTEPLDPQQLVHEQGLVRACRGLPARVRDDLIRAARLSVTRRGGAGREVPGTGLLPFFWRVHANLRWLLRQPATLKGQLSPGQIDHITPEQRAGSLRKTVAQRAHLGELAVLLHEMLQAPAGSGGAVPGSCDVLAHWQVGEAWQAGGDGGY